MTEYGSPQRSRKTQIAKNVKVCDTIQTGRI